MNVVRKFNDVTVSTKKTQEWDKNGRVDQKKMKIDFKTRQTKNRELREYRKKVKLMEARAIQSAEKVILIT